MYCLSVLEDRSPKSRCWLGHAPSESCREGSVSAFVLALITSGGSFVYRYIIPNLHLYIFPLCLYIIFPLGMTFSVTKCPLLIRTWVILHWGFILLLLLFSLSHIQLFATPWTVVHQVPLSTGFPRQEYWSGLPFPLPGDLPDTGIEPMSLALAGAFSF